MTARGLTPEQRFWLKVDKTGSCWLWTGSLDTWGYGQYTLNPPCVPKKKLVMAHRYAYELLVGPVLTATLDHRHTCPKTCVNPEHLRPATYKQQNENKGAQANSKSGIRGVYWRKDRDRWCATVRHHRQSFTVGYFKTIEEAEAAVVAKRIELFTHNDADRLVVV